MARLGYGGGGGGKPSLHLRQQVASATDSPDEASMTAAAFTTRTLNTEVINDLAGASMANGQFTLPAGDYWVSARAATHKPGRTQIRIRDVTNAVTALGGFVGYAIDTTSVGVNAEANGLLSPTADTTYEIQQYLELAGSANAAGVETASGEPEVYVELMVWEA